MSEFDYNEEKMLEGIRKHGPLKDPPVESKPKPLAEVVKPEHLTAAVAMACAEEGAASIEETLGLAASMKAVESRYFAMGVLSRLGYNNSAIARAFKMTAGNIHYGMRKHRPVEWDMRVEKAADKIKAEAE